MVPSLLPSRGLVRSARTGTAGREHLSNSSLSRVRSSQLSGFLAVEAMERADGRWTGRDG